MTAPVLLRRAGRIVDESYDSEALAADAMQKQLLAMTVNGDVRVPQVDFLISGLCLSKCPNDEDGA
jgi:hypothetical protein